MGLNTVIHNHRRVDLLSYRYNEVYFESDSKIIINGIEINGIGGTIMRIPIRGLRVISGSCSLLGKVRLNIFKVSNNLMGVMDYGIGSTISFDSSNIISLNNETELSYE